MKLSISRLVLIFAGGLILGALMIQLRPQPELKAAVANGNDKFTMCTVPVAPGETEAVFVLNHLTGVLVGAALNNTTGRFSHHYLRTVAADFQTAGGNGEPRYAIVSSSSNLRAAGASQPANGVLYIGELTSGAVIAYGFQMPRGQGTVGPIEVLKIDFFRFSEAAGR